jgi:SET family sugar efflux transporter-like MFS transporter
MVYFQELLPSIPGQATSLFNNSGNVGFILSGIVIMFIVPIGNVLGNISYGNTFLFSILFMVLAFLILLSIRKVHIRCEKK